MSKTLWIVAIAALALACGEKKNEGDKTGGGSAETNTAGSGEAKPDKPSGTPETPDGDDGDDGATKASCDCRMLTEHSLADLEGKTFGEKCEGAKLVSGASCDQYDELRNCIYAAHGNKFKRKKWQKHFGARDWYKPRDDFNAKELTKVELANVRALKQRSADCRAKSGGKVTGADIKIVTAWFKNRKKETPPLVWDEMSDDESENAAEQLEARLGAWKLNKKTKYWYQERPNSDGLVDKLKGKKYRVVTVGDCYECDDDDPDCEGGCDTFEALIGENNKVIAINLSVAAACPFVYAASGSEPLTKQGEILRHLDAPRLEGRQRLEIEASCESSISVRLAEEKPEITFLDEVYLEVDGVRHDVVGCAGANHCEDDGHYTKLSQGETLELVFEVNRRDCQRVELVADGFYMPL